MPAWYVLRGVHVRQLLQVAAALRGRTEHDTVPPGCRNLALALSLRWPLKMSRRVRVAGRPSDPVSQVTSVLKQKQSDSLLCPCSPRSLEPLQFLTWSRRLWDPRAWFAPLPLSADLVCIRSASARNRTQCSLLFFAQGHCNRLSSTGGSQCRADA